MNNKKILMLLIILFVVCIGAIVYSEIYTKTQPDKNDNKVELGNAKCYEITIPEYEEYLIDLMQYQGIFVHGYVTLESSLSRRYITISDKNNNDVEITVFLIDNSNEYNLGDDVYIYGDIDFGYGNEGDFYCLETGNSMISDNLYIKKAPVEGDEYMTVEECLERGKDIFDKITFKITGTIRTKDVNKTREYYIYDDDGNELQIFPLNGEKFEDGEKVTIIGNPAKYADSLLKVRHAD